ncbi:protein-PII uridylyltransferase [Phenylobacterium sp. Root77]|jgi:[protein-PII] uridylyltransferase|uniref:[protein-PII] uridylyltransferase n=1 Tax=unclassified Phenylobacterium TaxID=2640670 RepID=UPI0006F59A00|nr:MULTISPECIES: [protein-PII] uridylyltransferase [unclassified Phenylobacterium]KQW69104.1 protein-PII uridylyltransferase [Phenylobacterium sp. Root1277]KQW95529.1 protein-PII uridylyltransferase [Phenylobacterium sp. Root1290]KRC41319.1 protein-PII uridylyltransferase [Phenylobacterium sp. Root77]
MPPRLRPTRLEYVVDGVRLRAQLSAAALDAAGDELEQRRRALEILKQALFRGRMIAKERLENGAGGIETARLLSGVTDEVVTALYDFTTVHVFRARNPTEGERLALMAVGGYGRGTLAPFSDLDLLFLRPYKQTAHTESVIEYMLYALWDLGFKVGHASRTIEECVKLSREDYTIRTSILEARQLSGDTALAEDLMQRFRNEVVKGTAAQFVAAKLKERDIRQERAGASRYLVEPNVKEGKGGLRDLNTLFWIAQYLHPVSHVDGFVQLDMFDRKEVAVFIKAFDFLWAVRCHLHFATGRPEERLTFDLQPEIARRMGYGDRGDAPAVERFMRRYFLIAKEVGALTRVFAAKLEAEQIKQEPKGLSRLLPGHRKTKRKKLDPGFHEEGGRLNIDGPQIFEADPINMLRLFRLADQRDLDLHPDAFTAASRCASLIGSKVRRDPAAAKVFLDILAHGRDPQRTLSMMNEADVLGRFIPEWGRIVAQMQFNMYHSYTVDEHTLRAVGVIADIANGRFAEDHPLSTAIMPLIDDREALFLAMLLHDTGKGGAGGQEKAGARAARSACERLGLDRKRIEMVAWLVEHHLVMSDYAQKRDVSDPRTVADFARIVETPERLRLLLVLTVADIRAVGPGVWNGWKGQLMRELYGATEAVFRGGRGSDAAAAIRRYHENAAYDARVRLIAADPSATDWVQSMEDAYFTSFSDAEILVHAKLGRQAAETGAAAEGHIRSGLNASEVVIAAPDRSRLFVNLATTVTAAGANIVGARVFTSRQGQALDVFFVQDATGAAYGGDNPRMLSKLADALAGAGRGETTKGEPRRVSDFGRAAAFTITPTVMLDNEASEASTVVEASGRDRPGLLVALARNIADAGLSILSAHIDNYGERAVDAFYVTERDGGKLTDPKRMAALKADMMASLVEVEAAAPKPRANLQKARASVAR